MAKSEKNLTPNDFYKANTVEVKFPDGKIRRVNKFEAEALKKKLSTDKFKKLFGGKK